LPILAILKKTKDKFIEKGPRGFLIIVFGKIQRTWRRWAFQNLGQPSSHIFKPMPIGEITLIDYPKDQILQQLQENKYQILEGSLRNWGSSTTPGQLIWNSDLVKNYSWNSDQLGIELSIPFNQGDIKRPWELGRLHQLVQLALCYRAYSSQPEKKQQCLTLANQILKDFYIKNPKFLGPQWMCAMDVGIRISNICMAANIFGADFISENQNILNRELARHIFFIENNKENSWGSTVANHYYANLCGLIFAYAHSSHPKALTQLKCVARKMEKETFRQFSADGGNFEGSSYYHRLSGEFALFAFSCLAQRCNNETVVSSALWSRLKAIAQFSQAVSRTDGFVPQIGDNDSGHLFIFNPIQFQKDDLTHISLIHAMTNFTKKKSLNFADLVQDFINTKAVSQSQEPKLNSQGEERVFWKAKELWQKKKNARTYKFNSSQFNPNEISFFAFNLFGLFICKSKKFYLSVRCGVNPVDKGGGHRHRDQLSIYLFDGNDLTGRDPGSYIYTSDTVKRDQFRSALAHNGPFLGSGLRQEKSVFEMEDQFAECLYFGPHGFYGQSIENGVTFNRWISFASESIEIVDWTDDDQQLTKVDFKERFFSKQYGSYKDLSQ